MPSKVPISRSNKHNRHHLLCLYYVLDGLRLGLSKFSGPSRVALIYAVNPEDPLRILDPQGLLQGHSARLEEFYVRTDEWSRNLPEPGQILYDQTQAQCLELPGVLSLGGRARGTAYQMWFTDNHVDLCSSGPTYRWLEFALLQLSQGLIIQDILSVESAGHLLQEMAVHAVRDHIVAECTHTMGMSPRFRVNNLLESIIQISKTPEEGAWARGQLGFVEPSHINRVNFLACFPKAERPHLENYRHVRKLLQAVERSPRKLVSDGELIFGIAFDELPPPSLCCEFRGRHGMLTLDGEPVCSFSDGAFHGTNRRPKLGKLEEALQAWPMTPEARSGLFQGLARIVDAAREEKYGCAIVVDPGNPSLHLSGQTLESPLDLDPNESLKLAAALAKVDGALHIDKNMKLRAFACLMDGSSLPSEDRSRGARYNSALRFTANHPGLIVIVVSSDRPVSVIQNGIDLTRPPIWPPIPDTLRIPPTLNHWLVG
ncbi:MAG: DNA integrity scanning protein DisA nucleotide-binding domain protein [Syntrophales bacterium]|nr:DNA integrity scanning protein DisA nucleotide-binding domain protein [Syntrophales bacterium]